MEDNHLSSLLGSMELEKKDTKKAPATFDKLPVELRLKIWKEVCFIPRNIDVRELYARRWPGDRVYPDIFSKYRSYNPIPPILHTSHEARMVGLQHYSRSFATQMNLDGPPRLDVYFPPRIYANFDVDFVVPMGSSRETDNALGSLMAKHITFNVPLRRLAVLCEKTFKRNNFGYEKLMQDHQIEELIIFCGKLNSFQGIRNTMKKMKKKMKKMRKMNKKSSSPCPFPLELISLEDAKERGLIKDTKDDVVPKKLLADQKHIQARFEQNAKYISEPVSIPSIKIMYLLSPEERA